MSEQTEQSKQAETAKKTKARDYNPDLWRVISRTTKGTTTFLTEAMPLPPGTRGGVVQRDTVMGPSGNRVSTVVLKSVSLKQRRNGTWCYDGGN